MKSGNSELQGEGSSRRPSGESLPTPKWKPWASAPGISFVPEELGFYSIREGRLLHSYAVNPPPEESDLRPIDRAQSARAGQRKWEALAILSKGREDFQNLILGQADLPLVHPCARSRCFSGETALQFFVQRSQIRRP